MVGAKDAALKYGDNMPKNATEMTARRKSNCPECSCIVSPGSYIKVYNNKWYHNKCWDKMFTEVINERDRKRKIQKDLRLFNSIPMTKTTIKPDIIHKSSKQLIYDLYLPTFTNKVIDSLGIISKEIDSIWEEIGKEKITADKYNE
jgi:hypothetical protein